MTSFRRDALTNIQVQSDTHPGLWLDKYLKDDKDGSKQSLVEQVTGIGTPAVYVGFFDRWKNVLAERGAVFQAAEVLGRLSVNLGSEAVLETSIALHRTYGVPYIPGSALKGLAAHYVLNYQDKEKWGRNSETKAFEFLFGDTTSAGYVTFYDALYIPNTGREQKALWKDVITVHHSTYYQGNQPPADWDSPVPIPFISATGKFLIALSGPAQWVKAAFDILELALEREGIGAKTSSGYGRMRFENSKIRNGEGEKSAVENVPILPPKGATWKNGKVSGDGKWVQPADTPTQKLYFHREHVFPKGFTPARKSDVEYLEETLPNGSTRVWVKRMHYPIDYS
jgi:CRISPR-associated protein Cmr6